MRDLQFPKKYTWEILPGLPGVGVIHQFHRQNQRFHSEGTVVKVIPENRPSWIGNFQYDPIGVDFSGVFSSPDENKICVISRGQGYLVFVNYPSYYHILRASPITDIWSVLESKMMILVTMSEIEAYGLNGKIWRTKGLVSGKVIVNSVLANSIDGLAYRPEKGKDIKFRVDTINGEHELIDY